MTTWPDLTSLELLVAVADHGSLGGGARALHMAQPNASRSITRLERHLGVPLLVRRTTGSTLTPDGLLVVDWARDTLDAARRLTDGASALRETAPDAIAVAASQTVAEHLLPAWLSALRTEVPDITVALRVHNSSEVLDDVRAGRARLGFTESPAPPHDVHHIVVAHDELVLVVAPDHPWATRRLPVTKADLAATALVTREPGSGTRIALDEALGTPARALLELPGNAAVRVSAASGAAPAVLSRLAVADALAADTLRQVPLTGIDLRRPLRAVWIGPRRLTGAAASLVEIARRAGTRIEGDPAR